MYLEIVPPVQIPQMPPELGAQPDEVVQAWQTNTVADLIAVLQQLDPNEEIECWGAEPGRGVVVRRYKNNGYVYNRLDTMTNPEWRQLHPGAWEDWDGEEADIRSI